LLRDDLVAGSEEAREDDESDGYAIYRVQAPVAIEPEFGFIVHGRCTVIDASLPYSEWARRRETRQYFSGVPSLASLLRRRTEYLDGAVISLRHPWGSNHFHALVETAGAVAALHEQQLLDGANLVITEEQRSNSVLTHVVDAGLLAGAEIIVQRDQWIGSRDSVLFPRVWLSRQSLMRTRDLLTPRPADSPAVRLYVTRDSGVGRGLRNEIELRAALEDRGFVAVDPGSISFREQMELFARASHVVGVHGAGLTNILFRAPEPLHLLEIRPPGLREDMFRLMSVALGFQYERLVGLNPSDDSNRPTFSVAVSDVMAMVDRWLATRTDTSGYRS
jgi:capsular polysaccharide biosynthesis protein